MCHTIKGAIRLTIYAVISLPCHLTQLLVLFYFDVFGLSYFQNYLIILNLNIYLYVQTEIIS